MKRYFIITLIVLSNLIQAQLFQKKKLSFTRQDSLLGMNNSYRNWWDVRYYDLTIEPNYKRRFIKGNIRIVFDEIKRPEKYQMQIDLQKPMRIDSVYLSIYSNNLHHKIPLLLSEIRREGNAYFLMLSKYKTILEKTTLSELIISFSGHPKVAINGPWDGGWVFKKDDRGRAWMSVACQGASASVWFPNKDYLGDEPEDGATLSIIVPHGLTAIANGRLKRKERLKNGKTRFIWKVKNPINNYNLVPYIGHYVNFKDEFNGESGKLDLDYWVLDYNLSKAKEQFKQVKPMLRAFENWFGPYPFYEDSYKLVESPYLGMEHQSNIAYGNHYQNGYLGKDLSGTGRGLNWDFIIVHESGHEWFGNNITNQDLADMWVHEGFTSYSETLYIESRWGKQAASDYVIGTRKKIQNDRLIIGPYGVHKEGSGDMYYKGANMIHTLRQVLNNDQLFREILRGLNKTFYHQTVTTQQIEDYINQRTAMDLAPFFDQYLRTTKIPTLAYRIDKKHNVLKYKWINVVKGFRMPLKLAASNTWISPTEKWKTQKITAKELLNFKINRNFYIGLSPLAYADLQNR